MQPLTFAGFLKQYVRELSEQDTLSLYKLAEEAAHDNPRLREPLILYALFNDREKVLLRADKHGWLDRDLLKYSTKKMLKQLTDKNSALPNEYKKVYRSYLSVSSKKQTDDHTKALLHKRIRELQKENNVSNYKLYTELKLNPGNVNAYLKYCDTSKVSLGTARRMLEVAGQGKRTNPVSINM